MYGDSVGCTQGWQTAMRKDFMKKAKQTSRDELRASYSKGGFPRGLVRGKYASRVAASSNIVTLDPEISAAFPTSEAVNEALAGLLKVAKTLRQSKAASSRAQASRR
jgi:hypothetical protein